MVTTAEPESGSTTTGSTTTRVADSGAANAANVVSFGLVLIGGGVLLSIVFVLILVLGL